MSKRKETDNTIEAHAPATTDTPEAPAPVAATPVAVPPSPKEPELVSPAEAARRIAEAAAPKFETPRERVEREIRENVEKANRAFERACWDAAMKGDIRIKV